jgi:hypothetical protein
LKDDAIADEPNPVAFQIAHNTAQGIGARLRRLMPEAFDILDSALGDPCRCGKLRLEIP